MVSHTGDSPTPVRILTEKALSQLSSSELLEYMANFQPDSAEYRYNLHYIVPKHHPQMRKVTSLEELVVETFDWQQDRLQLTKEQDTFLQKIMGKPFNCIIAGGFARRYGPGGPKDNGGDIDVFIPVATNTIDLLKLAATIFTKPPPYINHTWIYVALDFCELFFPHEVRNIQLIHNMPRGGRGQDRFIKSTLMNFDLTYSKAAIWRDTTGEFRWGCSPSFACAIATNSTYSTTPRLACGRYAKAIGLGFQVLDCDPRWLAKDPKYKKLQPKLQHNCDNHPNSSYGSRYFTIIEWGFLRFHDLGASGELMYFVDGVADGFEYGTGVGMESD